MGISIHALREEGDLVTKANELAVAIFLSTPSARRATRGGGFAGKLAQKFLSTPSARRATPCCAHHAYVRKFLSTPSARRATRVIQK